MNVKIYRTGNLPDARRALVLARVVQGKRPGESPDPVNGVQINEVRYTTKSSALLSTYGLASCIAVAVVNLKTNFTFAALAHCQTCDHGRQLLKDVADLASERYGKDDLKLQVIVCCGYSNDGTTAEKLELRNGLLTGIELYIEEDDRYMSKPDLSHFGLTRPWDGNFYFMLLACREGAYDIVLANRESVDATPGARRFFEQAVGLMDYDIETKIAAEMAKQGTSFPRHLVRLGAEVL